MNRVTRHLAIAAAALWVAACGRGPELIDRTQPNYIRKADLLSGTWYIQDTIVDVPPTEGQAAIGFGGGLDKVRFEIQENHLVAFRTYEWVPGTDPLVDQERSTIGKVVTIDGRPYRGAPVAAWPIMSHFDRQRQYNAATGEQSNILVEDTQDRPWYQREFIRVNWATNVISNYNDGTDDLMTKYSPIRTYVTPIDQNIGDNAFVMEYRNTSGKDELYYFDFTTRAILNPMVINYPGYGDVPYCLLNPRVDCESTEIKLRTSVLKVDEAHVQDYEPLHYDDKLMTKFGYFRTERTSYDRNRGVTESGRILYANRHNIWVRSHDEAGNVIPVEQREPKPIVYYLTPNWPEELLDAAKDIEKSWDFAFRRAVAVPQGKDVSHVPQMFYVCRTPVPENAPAACGKPGLSVRLGDLRYNMMPWIDQPQLSGPLGLGPSAADPETGEIIQGVANIYGAALDVWAGDAHTVLDVLTGELSIADLVAGKNVKDYVFANLNPTDPRRPASGPWSSKSGLIADPQTPVSSFAAIQGPLKSNIQAMLRAGTPPVLKQDRRKVVDAIISNNPALESELINQPEVRALVMSKVPGGQFRTRLENDPTLYRQVARQTLLHTGELNKLEQKRIEWASQVPNNGCMYLAEFADDAMLGLAKDMKKVYDNRFAQLRASGVSEVDARARARHDVWNEIRAAAVRAIGEHELGHTLGLRHNFVGSFDALNFQDGYWDLRKQTIGVNVSGQRVLPLTPQNLLDASKPNQEQIENRMGELQYSTVMDYGSRINADVHGTGKYDAAAILFAYSGGGEPGYVEVFTEYRRQYGSNPDDGNTYANVQVPTDIASQPLTVRGAQVEIPFSHVQHYTQTNEFYSDKFHYTTLPFHFAERSTISTSFEAALDEGIRRMNSRSFRKWSDMEPVYALLQDAYHKYLRDKGDWTVWAWDSAAEIVAKQIVPPVEVPYMFCTDDAVGANPACNRWDSGADLYEITRDWIERYQEYYVFNAYRRDRLGSAFSPDSYLSRIYGRLLGNLPNIYQQWLFTIYWYQYYYGYSTEQMDKNFGIGDPIWQNYWTMAVVDGTNTLMQALSTPSTGYHGKLANGNWVHLPGNNGYNGRFPDTVEAQFKASMLAQGYTDVVYVPRGPGRSMYTLYDGEGMDFFARINEVGHFWDQVAALSALTTSETNFLGVDRGADALRYSLPYYMTFNRELSKTFSNVWTEDRAGYASQLIKTGNGLANVVPPVFVNAKDYVAGFEYPPPRATPVDGNGNPLPIEYVEASPTWSTKFYTEVWGMAYFTENFNQEFASFNQVFRVGSGEQLTPATGFEVVTFDDPFGSGYTYAAMKKTGDTSPPSAPKMVASATTFKAKWDQARTSGNPVDGLTAAEWESKTREAVRSLEIMRGLYNVFSQTW